MAILTEHEAGIWGATLATVQEQRERIAQLEAALGALAAKEPYGYDDYDMKYCPYCDGSEWGAKMDENIHTSDCPWVVAKNLLPQP